MSFNQNDIDINNNDNNNLDLFNYIELDNDLFTNIQRNQQGYEQHNEQSIIQPQLVEQEASQQSVYLSITENKLTKKADYACIRLITLGLLYYLDGYTLTPFLYKLICFLLVHECLVLSNFLYFKIYISLRHCCITTIHSHVIVFSNFIDKTSNMIYFIWFIYGNICILADKKGVEQSLQHNILVTYYLTILILFGFFLFAKIVFYLIFFIAFCPCISYVMFQEFKEDYQQKQRAKRLQEKLKGMKYETYLNTWGKLEDICVICNEEFNDDELIIMLSCDNKHVFHENCIKTWIKQKTICPICRAEIN